MELWLVRHAKAGTPGPEWPDDRLRPLTPAGERRAAQLAEAAARVRVRLDRLFSSPWVRAAQTAEPLRAVLRGGRTVEYLDALAQGEPEILQAALQERLAPGDACVACVGHEPFLSDAASFLLTGRVGGIALAFRKSAALLLEGDPGPAAMALRAFLPPLPMVPPGNGR